MAVLFVVFSLAAVAAQAGFVVSAGGFDWRFVAADLLRVGVVLGVFFVRERQQAWVVAMIAVGFACVTLALDVLIVLMFLFVYGMVWGLSGEGQGLEGPSPWYGLATLGLNLVAGAFAVAWPVTMRRPTVRSGAV